MDYQIGCFGFMKRDIVLDEVIGNCFQNCFVLCFCHRGDFNQMEIFSCDYWHTFAKTHIWKLSLICFSHFILGIVG